MTRFAVMSEIIGETDPCWVIVVFDDMGVRHADGFPPFALERDAQAYADTLNDQAGK